jgi:CRP/FNR family transcriptional regulator
MKKNEDIRKIFEHLGDIFLYELEESGIQKTIAARKDVISEGETIKYIPILINGSVKVYSLDDGKELVYYYIKPYESCTMTFASIFTNSKSRIYACTEESCDVLLLPVDNVLSWIIEYPLLNQFFLKEYDKRYTAIMEMVTQAVFYKLDKRIMDLLDKRIKENDGKAIKISHKEIANTLGTAREVVSRILKKHENDGLISQSNQGIAIVSKN